MTTIYLLVIYYATFKNNEFYEEEREEPLYAFTEEEKAKEEKERILNKDYEERQSWFKEHSYGIFIRDIEIKETNLYE